MAATMQCSVHYEGSQFLCHLTELEMQKLNEETKGDGTFLKWVVENKSSGIIFPQVVIESGQDGANYDLPFTYTDSPDINPSGSDQLPPQKSSKTEKLHWDKTTVKFLLSLIQEDKDRFKDPKVKRKDFWQDKASKITLKGKNVSGRGVHKKFNNLYETYKRMKEKERKSGECTAILWDYYDDFKSIYDGDDDYDDDPSIMQVSASMPSGAHDSPSPTPTWHGETLSPVSTLLRGLKRRLEADNEPKKTTPPDELAQGRQKRVETRLQFHEMGKKKLATKKEILALAKEKLELEKQRVQSQREVEEKSATEISSAIRYLADAILKKQKGCNM